MTPADPRRSVQGHETGSVAMRVRAGVVDTVVAHARGEAPLECCGLLIGTEGSIEEAIPAVNVRRSETAYLIDPAAQFAAIRRVRLEGRTVLGAYHSHPRSPAVPSRTDLEEAYYPEFVYLIISLADGNAPDVRGYRLHEGAFAEIVFALE
jgi:proteasome lid subunit RPN8/RPN11